MQILWTVCSYCKIYFFQSLDSSTFFKTITFYSLWHWHALCFFPCSTINAGRLLWLYVRADGEKCTMFSDILSIFMIIDYSGRTDQASIIYIKNDKILITILIPSNCCWVKLPTQAEVARKNKEIKLSQIKSFYNFY